MTDMQNLVERLERAVGRLEAVSHTSDMHCGYGDSPSKGKPDLAGRLVLSLPQFLRPGERGTHLLDLT